MSNSKEFTELASIAKARGMTLARDPKGGFRLARNGSLIRTAETLDEINRALFDVRVVIRTA